MYDDVVLFAGGDRKMTAVSAQTGESLWTKPHYRAGHNSPEDVLVIDGLAWTGDEDVRLMRASPGSIT